ncbi:tetratricopeptide repeat protein [Lentzea sp. NPDC006480]|uniref:ATP-binding protein n=1 Tax=Lentzea sp. NPDC006480 TaxID=3157176 RepID=UPI0033AA3215
MSDDPTTRNDLSGEVSGQVVQAGVVHGDVHFHAAEQPHRGIPRQLPGVARHFTNRIDEQSSLTELLATAGVDVVIASIDGTAGIGKTALALYWSHQVADRFPDGQLYVNLRGFDPAAEPANPGEVLGDFLDALGVPGERIPASTAARAALYRSLLAGRRVLVVLDNAADADQVRPLLPGMHTCLALVTSRNHLSGLVVRDGARRLPLDVLTDGEAQALLASHIGVQRIAAEPDAVGELVRRCAHLPLALSIAAARMAGSPAVTLGWVVNGLRQEQDRLDYLDIDDDTGVRSVFSWSYRRASAAAAGLFRQLGLPNTTDLGLAAVAALADQPQRQVRQLLGELCQAHLLEEYRPGRYRFHDLLHAYARERAEQDDPQARKAALRRLLDWYLRTAHNADKLLRPKIYTSLALPASTVTPATFHSEAEVLAWYSLERASLFLLVRQAREEELYEHTWQLPHAIVHFCRLRGDAEDCADAMRIGVEAARALGDRQAEADTLRRVAVATFDAGRYEEALSIYGRVLPLYEEIDDHATLARTLADVGDALVKLGRHEEAVAHLENALELQDGADVRQRKDGTFLRLGRALSGLERYDEAITYFQDALALSRTYEDPYGEGYALHDLGEAHAGRNDSADAVRYYDEAIALRRRIGHHTGEGLSLFGLGGALHRLGDLDGARRCWEQALIVLDTVDHPEAAHVRDRLAELG